MTSTKLLLLFVVFNALATSMQAEFPDLPYNPYRLPYTLKPSTYKVKLTPKIDDHTFDGEVEMKFTAEADDVDRIVMHSRYLENIVVDTASSNVAIENITFESRYDFMTLKTVANLTKGQEYTLRLTFNGKIQQSMEGFYNSFYEEETTKKEIGTTMSFPTYARSIFPCFDEPGYKAEYSISIQCPVGNNCISNMKEKNNTNGLVEFHPTPLMSSYLIAFIVSDFVVANGTDEPRQFRIWSRPGAKDMGEYAFKIGQTLVDNMGEYTGIKYFEMDDNMKMDHVAIPDFPAGAMENWGIITYREDNLLFDPDHSSIKNKQRVASVVAHEIAHMWFGDLATYNWFYCPWMSEGFGRFFEHFLTESAEEFGMEDQFIGGQVHTAMRVDSSLDAKPMTYPFVNSPGDILSHFGTISYNKGASILRMVQHWIGSENFQKGLQAYLNAYKYDTATPDNLFDALDANTDVTFYNTTVKDLMTEWTTRSGYPLLSVSIHKDTGNIVMFQRRYSRELTGDVYPIPITYTTANTNNFNDTKPKFIHNVVETTMTRPDGGWIIFNIQQTGFYRVKYDDDLLDLLIKALNGDARKTIHRFNRAQIVDDAINLARDNYISISRMLDTIQFLEHDTDFAPWAAAFTGLNFIRLHLGRIETVAEQLDEHISNLMINVIDHVRDVTEKDENLLRLFRSNTMNFACALGDEYCIRNSTVKFQNLKNDSIEVDPDSREFVYCNGLRYGDASDYDFLWERYVGHNVPSEKTVILGALGCTRVTAKLNEYLMRTLEDDSKIREQDRMQAYNSALTGNPENVEKTYLFIVDNIAKIKEVYGSGIVTMMTSMSTRMSENELGRLEAFVESSVYLTPSEKGSVKYQITANKREAIFMASKSQEVLDWIDYKYNSAGSITSSIMLIISMVFVLIK